VHADAAGGGRDVPQPLGPDEVRVGAREAAEGEVPGPALDVDELDEGDARELRQPAQVPDLEGLDEDGRVRPVEAAAAQSLEERLSSGRPRASKYERSLYRESGKRGGQPGGRVVDPVSLRAGVVGDGWLPGTARVMAHQVQQGTSREAEATAREFGRLPYSRASFERVAHLVGALAVADRRDIEDVLIDAYEYEVPAEAHSLSVSLDRVRVPMEEPRPRPVGRPRKGAPKRPVQRKFHMACCGTVTVHDEDGVGLHTIRYGCMPSAAKDILKELVASGMDEGPGEDHPVHAAITRFQSHSRDADRMNCARARRLGLALGSGNVEATCKSLFEIGLKGFHISVVGSPLRLQAADSAEEPPFFFTFPLTSFRSPSASRR